MFVTVGSAAEAAEAVESGADVVVAQRWEAGVGPVLVLVFRRFSIAQLSEAQAALFEGKNVGALGTIRPDGTPHVSPVWVDYDGEHVVFNTARGRAKEQHMAREPKVTLTVWNAESPYEDVESWALRNSSTRAPSDHINSMAKKYLGQDTYPWLQPGEQRVIVKVTPTKALG